MVRVFLFIERGLFWWCLGRTLIRDFLLWWLVWAMAFVRWVLF